MSRFKKLSHTIPPPRFLNVCLASPCILCIPCGRFEAFLRKITRMVRIRKAHNSTTDLRERAGKIFARSPLSNFLPLIEKTITDVTTTTDPSGQAGTKKLIRVIEYYERLFANGFGPRFHLDAWLADDICREWSTANVVLPGQIVPVYGDQWAYSILPFVWSKANPLSVYVVCFPGRSEIADINLFEYPWLWHELGHHLLSRAGATFATNFKAGLNTFVKATLRKATADSSGIRVQTSNFLTRLQPLWTPSPNTRDWAHELGADAIALWTCGPAFLMAVEHALANVNIDPYQISESHPPYELRVRTLIELAENLEWSDHCAVLKATLQKWQTEADNRVDVNRYSALADQSLADECSSQIVKACRSWDLPLCTPERVRSILPDPKADHEFGSATDLLLAAWSVNRRQPDAFETWESATLGRLANDLNSDSR